MKTLTTTEIDRIIQQQRMFFSTHQTKNIDFRLKQLKHFRTNIIKKEKDITEALWKDLHKSYEEAYLTEIGIVLQELTNHINHLKKWAKPKKVSTPLFLFPSKSRIMYEPLGVSLIIAPWNYPFQLLMNPLIGAISSGCCAILKASPYAPETAKIMEQIIRETFPPEYVTLLQGHRDINQLLLEKRFDAIFFTGSPALGKVVMEAASRFLTPVVLELGGKSPCIVDKDADINIAAKRIIWGKTINAGQTCIAPDYLFVHKDIKDSLLKKMEEIITAMFGNDPQQSAYYPRIVNLKSLLRIQKLMQDGEIVCGGKVDENDLYIAPTIIENIHPEHPVMQEEIFGPVLPVMPFSTVNEVEHYINSHEKPLAFYYFGHNKQAKKILHNTTSGGACINDTLMHIANHHLPFGGVGNSGLGRYHGIDSFRAFSNQRSVLATPTWMDMPMRYVPFKNFSITKKFLK